MKINPQKLTLLIFLLIGQVLIAQSTFKVMDAVMHVNGTSSIHDWTSDVTTVNIYGKLTQSNGALEGLSDVQVSIPVKSIRSTKGSVMDNKTWGALEADKHPNITFKMTGVSTVKAYGSGTSVEVKGQLTLAGKTRNITLKVESSYLGNNIYEFSGIQPIKMTDYGINPPTALLGTLKTGDDVTIDYIIKVKAEY